MYMGYLPTCVLLVCLVPTENRRGYGIHPEVGVSQHAGAVNGAWVLWKSGSCSLPLSCISSLIERFYFKCN